MKLTCKTVMTFYLTIMLVGCGGDSGSSGTETDDSSSTTSAALSTSSLDSIGSWLTYTDLNDEYISIVHDGVIYGVDIYSDEYFVGSYSEVYLPSYDTYYLEVDADISGTTYSVDLYPCTEESCYSDIDESLFLLAKGQSQTQSDLIDTWGYYSETSDNQIDSFTIDSTEGLFYMVESQTGCTLDGQITYLDKGVYYIAGDASGCIDGDLEGEFVGLGAMPAYLSEGTVKGFIGLIKYSDDSYIKIEFNNLMQ